ncbi:MAG TPA: Wzz/FepE/Etk N-terminal domain-containing protein [Nocardioidaceae bacterium]|nr:Wzz/FepE/Etk N-terminal domain-containing protein [Nocardioidaceae bacterium]
MNEARTEVPSLELGRYVNVVRRRRVVVAVVTAVTLLFSGIYLVVKDRQATATAVVNINIIRSDAFNNDRSLSTLLDAQTELQLARSADVMTRAAEILGNGATVQQLRSHTRVSPLPASTIVRVSFSAASVEQAVAGADALATSYLRFRQAQAEAKVEAITARLNERGDVLRKKLIGANTTRSNAPAGSPSAVQAASDVALTTIQLQSLSDQINALESVDTAGGNVITSAGESPVTITPSRGMVLLTGLLGGLLIGAVAAFVLHALDRRVFDAAGVARAGGGTVLARLREPIGGLPPSGIAADDTRVLRERLLAALPEQAAMTIVELPGGGGSADVAGALAWAYARGKQPVHLVLPLPDAGQVEGLSAGLELQVDERQDRFTRYRSSTSPHLVVSVGAVDPSDGLVKELVEAVPGHTVLVALGPDVTGSARLAVVREFPQVLLVVRPGRTKRAQLVNAVAELESVGGEVLGSVLAPVVASAEPVAPGVTDPTVLQAS